MMEMEGSDQLRNVDVCRTHLTMDAFKGKYERTSAEKYEEMLKELDVNFLLRKAATASTPSRFS